MIAALYVETGGLYYGPENVDPWDEQRDARLYDGPWPVVAHPPCQRWCRFAKGIEKVHGHKVGDDGGCFAAALEAVRTYGGVLEHPAGSLAWDAFGLPKPRSSGGWTRSFLDAGYSCYVEQGRYGHPMRKATWLYACAVPELPALAVGPQERQRDARRVQVGLAALQARARPEPASRGRAALAHAACVPRRADRDGRERERSGGRMIVLLLAVACAFAAGWLLNEGTR